ncbi:TetR/AcrR family transcriptional regulator [Microcella sp.]|uniref:TetR/AcrR family transcriptional regulator n=1 Tax=Microcella sp. TaxID=1913979 RepID=UPI003919363A
MNSELRRRTRSDATRNRDLILSAAMVTLNESPRASMEEIAVVAGVSRATLYAHFPTRQALVVTTLKKVLSQANAQIAGLDPELSPEEAVDALVVTSWRLLGQFQGMTVAAEREVSARELRRMHDESAEQIRRLLIQGRRDGSFRVDQDLHWQVECVYALVRAGFSHAGNTNQAYVDPSVDVATSIRAVLSAVREESDSESSQPRHR